MENLKKILALYGFDDEGFSNKVYQILLMAIEFHHPKKSAKELLDIFNDEDLIKVLNNLIFYSQQFLFARQDERWELFIPLWIEENKAELFDLCLGTKLCEPVTPTKIEYDAVAIFGANKSEIYRRYKFVLELLKSKTILVKNSIYLLTGQRKLTPRIDGSQAYFDHLHHRFGETLYETHLMIDLFDRFGFAHYLGESIKTFIVDTPPGNSRRPNTFDTLVAMKDQLRPQEQTLLFISRSPAYWEQKAAVDRVFGESGLEYEVAGGSCTLSEVSDKARASYHILMSLAGALYENYLVVARSINDERKIYSDEQIQGFKHKLGFRALSNKEVLFSDKPLTTMSNKTK